MIALTVDPHPLLDASVFATEFHAPLDESPSPDWLRALLRLDASAPLSSDDAVRAAIRALLRHGGFKPSGRSKPASEYLIRAVEQGELDSINAAVDACNAVSLHSGIPISVIDLDRAREPFRIGVADAGERYVFNASGQEMDLEGLLLLYDADGPCANSVKDSQRTKTQATTRRTLTVLWSSSALPGRAAQATVWYGEILRRLGATVQAVTPG